MRYISICALITLFLLAACSDPAERDAKVGRLHRAFVDDARTDWANSGPRPLATTVWYQAANSSVESEWRIGVFRFGHNALNAPFDDTRKRPLIILSHGTGGSAAQLSWLAESLVSAGYVVAGVNHHGNTAAESTSWPHGFALPGERARDISALIDQLFDDEEIAPFLDAERVGVAGFSIGGYSALASSGAHFKAADWHPRCETQPNNPVCRLPPEAGFTEADIRNLASSDATFKQALARDEHPVSDPRIRAVYAIAPAFVSLMTKDEFASLDVPTRVVLAQDDQQILASETLSALRMGVPNAAAITIPDAGHYAFLATCTFRGKIFLGALCRDSRKIDRDQLHARIGADAATFFGVSL